MRNMDRREVSRELQITWPFFVAVWENYNYYYNGSSREEFPNLDKQLAISGEYFRFRSSPTFEFDQRQTFPNPGADKDRCQGSITSTAKDFPTAIKNINLSLQVNILDSDHPLHLNLINAKYSPILERTRIDARAALPVPPRISGLQLRITICRCRWIFSILIRSSPTFEFDRRQTFPNPGANKDRYQGSITAKRKLEILQFSTSSSYVKIWSVCSGKFKAYFWTFWALY